MLELGMNEIYIYIYIDAYIDIFLNKISICVFLIVNLNIHRLLFTKDNKLSFNRVFVCSKAAFNGRPTGRSP